MNNISFTPQSWDEYLYWQMQDKKTMRRIHQLLKDRDSCWSRRIDDKNRLVYLVDGESDIIVISCKGHYED